MKNLKLFLYIILFTVIIEALAFVAFNYITPNSYADWYQSFVYIMIGVGTPFCTYEEFKK